MSAGTRFLITQPVSYYDECWRVMDDFASFCEQQDIAVPVVLGVFNYSVPCGTKGFREEVFQKRYKFWKRLFGFVPEGVRADYEKGLNGIEILARSINKLMQKGYYHFDVMNAERHGATVLQNRQRLTHESDRLSGSFDESVRSRSRTA
jgi:5,10-methylenetetrahydrofolate reductase